MQGLDWIDWLVVVFYLGAIAGVAWRAGRKHRRVLTNVPVSDGELAADYALAGRSIPPWAAAVSFMATALSAATFIGLPNKGYASNLTYLATNIGAFIAIAVVAFVFIPMYYRKRVTTVYELLGMRFGAGAAWLAGVFFLLGRLFASGARLYIAGGAVAFLITPFDADPTYLMMMAIAGMVLLALIMVAIGGMRSVIWTDVCQATIFVIAALVVIVLLLYRIPLDISEIVHHLGNPGEGADSKLTVIQPGITSFSPEHSYTLLAIILGVSLINLGAYGTDQDMTQRLLTCKDARSGAKSAFMAVIMAIPVTSLFIAIGMLLWIFYDRPDLMQAAAPGYNPTGNDYIFAIFIAQELPSGLGGLLAAGLMAAAVSGLTSEINAMGSTAMNDCYKPLVRGKSAAHYLVVSRNAGALSALGLGVAAVLCIAWKALDTGDLIDFALMVMMYCYSGLVAIFCCAILLPGRGSNLSAMAALVTGFVAITVMQWVPLEAMGLMPGDGSTAVGKVLAFPFQMTIATGLALLVCMFPSSNPQQLTETEQ